jgi:hypothetical protein
MKGTSMAEKILTQNRLKELLEYNPETGLFVRKKTTAPNAQAGNVAGCLNKHIGYRSISIDGKEYYCHRLAFLYMTGNFPEKQVDHINRIKDDNRWTNLRKVTSGENLQNTSLRKSNKSGAKGVFWYAQRNKWIAYIRFNNKRYSLGYYINFEDAVTARKQAEDKYFTHHKG